MRRYGGNKGLTLIEAIMSVMIMAMAAVAMSSVIISTSMAYKKSELRQTALYMISTASEKLRDFVVANDAAVPTALRNGYYQGLCGEDNASRLPLALGTQDLSCYFDMPYGTGNAAVLGDIFPGTAKEFYYTVTFVSCCDTCSSDLTCKKVEFTINYTTD